MGTTGVIFEATEPLVTFDKEIILCLVLPFDREQPT